MSLHVLSQQQILDKIKDKENFALYVHSPMCGTCQLAQRMVHIANELDDISVSIFEANVAEIQGLVRNYHISSIPCLIVWHKGLVKRQEYALGSVDRIYSWLKK